ncbi:MAG: CoA transferase [Candidatus Bathyarchaeota archaeon B23]|nr:MAG: CoA transferase [Candidatus Bathyarchaeota archaeon B23]
MAPPLRGIRVLDLSQVVAGPFCSMLLADMGAEVIKVERPGVGDNLRRWGPPFLGGEGVYFLYLNRNKKSITLNLKSEEGRRIFTQLLKRSDVLLENFRPGTMERLGFGYEEASRINPRIIYCRVSGYGQTGPYRDRGGYDLLAQGESGLISVTGEPDRPPGAKVGVAIVDMGTGLYAAVGILLALRAREKTGRGQLVDVSLLDSAVSWMLQPLGYYLAMGQLPKRLGTAHPVAAPYQTFRTRDIYITIGCAADRNWRALCRVLGLEELADDPRFSTNPRRVENREELARILGEVFEGESGEVWLRRLQEAGVPCAPVNTVDRVVEHPQLGERGMFVEVKHPKAGRLRLTGIPVKLSETPGEIHSPPPLLGEHTEEILGWLGYSPEEIRELRGRGVI